MNSKYYAKILKSQGDELIEYDNNIPPEKLMEIFPSDNIVYVNNIPPEDMIERYRNQWSEDNQSDIRLVYVSSIPIGGFPPYERIEFIEASTHKLLKEKYHRERLIYINSVTPELLAIMTPEERYEIKSDLVRMVVNTVSGQVDIRLLVNMAIPFFTIFLKPDELRKITESSRVHGSTSKSELVKFQLLLETELNAKIFNKLKRFQQCLKEEILRSGEGTYKKKWDIISGAYSLRYSCSSPENEADCLDLFKHYIGYPTTNFLDAAGHVIDLKKNQMVSDKSSQVSSSNGRSTDQVKGRPDLLYLKNEVPLLIVEVKGPRFSDLVKDGINESSEAFKSIKRQVGRYFVVCKTTRAMITNFHHTLYIEIDESRFSQLKELTDDNNEVEIPCNYKLLSLEGRGLTVQAVVLNSLFIESADEEELLKKYQKKVFNIIDNITSKKYEEQGKLLDAAIKDSLVKEIHANSNINPQKSNSHVEGECESWTGFEVLQGEGHRSHVYKFRVDLLCKFFPFFNEVLTGLKQDYSVIMKLFIPSVVARLRGWPIPDTEDVKACIHSFLKEASCYESIERHNSSSDDEKDKINVPTLYYYGAFRMNVKDSGPIEGYYLLLSYVEEDKTIITKSMVENGCRQLELMGDIGIQHHDIATRNCKVADGNIVFLDFSHAKNRESKYDNSDDIHDLKYIYEYNKLEESDDDKYSTVGSAPFSEVQFPSTAGTEPTKPDSK